MSRDRGGAYADGARRGAPQATQVADRWHLLRNATEVLETVLRRQHAALRAAAKAATPMPPADPPVSDPAPVAPERPPTREGQERALGRERRLARYREVMALHEQGCSQRQIAAAVGIGRRTVRRFLRADGPPEPVMPTRRASTLDRYEPYLRERWTAGCDNALQLWRELRERGFPGSASNVRHYLGRWRAQPSRPGKKGPRPVAGRVSAPPPPTCTYSPRQAAWLLLREQAASGREPLTEAEAAYAARLRDLCPEVTDVQAAACAFHDLVAAHDGAALATWLAAADRSATPELRGFAERLRADRAAVEAGLTLPWSQGQTEGQVNRLKTLKRAMYGRAKFDLLRLRVLHAA